MDSNIKILYYFSLVSAVLMAIGGKILYILYNLSYIIIKIYVKQ